jgi:transcriptional regulator with XRE-family HTH domain
MNPIEGLRDALLKRFPDIAAEIDAPADEAAGLWQLDVRPGGGSPGIVVEWRPDFGFGVSTPGADDYGTRPDEMYANPRAAYDRVVQLILSGRRTEPPAAVRLAELRRSRKLSQAEVAGRAGIKQAAVARIEGRGDILLSTLGRIVSAMGGRLSIRAEFPDGTARELTGLVPLPSARPGKEIDAASRSVASPAASASPRARTEGRGTKTVVDVPGRHRAEPAVGSEDEGPRGAPPAKGRGESARKERRQATDRKASPRTDPDPPPPGS